MSTVVEFYGEQNKSGCGYCKGKRCNFSHGMHAYIMTEKDYQDLIDRGWRRSGQYCYKPNNKITCCPCYTIKCDCQEFKLSKSHKKILRRMNKFLTDGIKEKDEMSNKSEEYNSGEPSSKEKESSLSIREETETPNITPRNINLSEIEKGMRVPEKKYKVDSEQSKTLLNDLPSSQNDNQQGESPTPSRPICKKAKQIRLERKKLKLEAKGISPTEFLNSQKNKKNQEKTLSEYLNDVPENARHKLKIKLVEVNSSEFHSSLKDTYGLYEKYETKIHNHPPEGVNDYLYFLQRSPLKIQKTPDGPPDGYGSFHQQYWLDDRLIAVGVIDILPYCVSSVYFFYDPDFSFLSLGTYGSLREIDLTRQLSEIVPRLKYYYMGFYIHSCPKMRYKSKLAPSYLLCPEVYTWHLITDEMKKKLDENKYCRFNEDPNAKDENEFNESDMNLVLLMLNESSFVTYEEYVRIVGGCDEASNILEYGRLVGKTCAHRMLYVQ